MVQGATWWTGTVLALMGGRFGELVCVDVTLALGLQIRGFMLFPAHNFCPGLGSREKEIGSRL